MQTVTMYRITVSATQLIRSRPGCQKPELWLSHEEIWQNTALGSWRPKCHRIWSDASTAKSELYAPKYCTAVVSVSREQRDVKFIRQIISRNIDRQKKHKNGTIRRRKKYRKKGKKCYNTNYLQSSIKSILDIPKITSYSMKDYKRLSSWAYNKHINSVLNIALELLFILSYVSTCLNMV